MASLRQSGKQLMYSGPRDDILAVLPEGGSEPVTLTCDKLIVVLVSRTLTEGVEIGLEESDIRPPEEGHEGMRVCDADETRHEFDTLQEAEAFARTQLDPDRNPVEITILRFQNGYWRKVRGRSRP
jgi:hypothetical protein